MEAAERLKISAENLNSMLTTSLQRISDEKKNKKIESCFYFKKKKKEKGSKD